VRHAFDFLYGGALLREYVLSIVGTVLLSAVITAILPDGKTAVTIKSVAKTLCVLIIVSPILTYFQRNAGVEATLGNPQINFLETDIQSDQAFIQYFSNQRVLQTQALLETELKERYGLSLTVVCVWEWRKRENVGYEEVYISQIRVQGAKEERKELQQEILEYLTKNYCEEVLLE
jgi:hypothetical protein